MEHLSKNVAAKVMNPEDQPPLDTRLMVCKTIRRIVWQGQEKPDIDRSYRNYCRKNELPYVRVVMHQDNADIVVRCPYLPKNMEPVEREAFNKLLYHYHCEQWMNRIPGWDFKVTPVPHFCVDPLVNDFLELERDFKQRIASFRADAKLVQRVIVAEDENPTKPLRLSDCLVILTDGRKFGISLQSRGVPPSEAVIAHFEWQRREWREVY